MVIGGRTQNPETRDQNSETGGRGNTQCRTPNVQFPGEEGGLFGNLLEVDGEGEGCDERGGVGGDDEGEGGGEGAEFDEAVGEFAGLEFEGGDGDFVGAGTEAGEDGRGGEGGLAVGGRGLAVIDGLSIPLDGDEGCLVDGPSFDLPLSDHRDLSVFPAEGNDEGGGGEKVGSDRGILVGDEERFGRHHSGVWADELIEVLARGEVGQSQFGSLGEGVAGRQFLVVRSGGPPETERVQFLVVCGASLGIDGRNGE